MYQHIEARFHGLPVLIRQVRPEVEQTIMVHSPRIEYEGITGKQGADMAAALTRLAEMDALADISDAATLEREERKDRELPGRSA